MLMERLLNYRQFTVVLKALDGGDVRTITLHGERQARPDAVAVQQDCARPADALFATDMRTGEMKLFSKKIRQQQTRLNGTFEIPSIDLEIDAASLHFGAEG